MRWVRPDARRCQNSIFNQRMLAVRALAAAVMKDASAIWLARLPLLMTPLNAGSLPFIPVSRTYRLRAVSPCQVPTAAAATARPEKAQVVVT